MDGRTRDQQAMPTPCIHAFADTERFARQVARATGSRFARVNVHRFPDGESLVRIHPPPGREAVLVRSLHDPNTKLVETLLAADALRRAGAQQVILVTPYLPYMRQDTVFMPGEPISQQVLGNCLGRAFDRVLAVEPHLHRVRRLADVIPCRAQSLSAAPVLAQWLRRTGGLSFLVGPDEESERWVRAIARVAQLPWVVGRKERLSDHSVHLSFPNLPPCPRAVIVDDVVSSGGTLAAAARTLRRQGVTSVDAVVVHALFAPGALARIRAAGVRTIASCDTVPHPTNAIRSAPLVAAALKEIFP